MLDTHFFSTAVLVPKVNVVSIGNQVVGNPLSLTCKVTTVRDTNGSIDIIWMRDGTEILRDNNKEGHPINDKVMLYTSYYNITQLQMIDDDTTYNCQAVINTSPPVNSTGNHTLKVIGGFNVRTYVCTSNFLYVCTCICMKVYVTYVITYAKITQKHALFC